MVTRIDTALIWIVEHSSIRYILHVFYCDLQLVLPVHTISFDYCKPINTTYSDNTKIQLCMKVDNTQNHTLQLKQKQIRI
uniref:CG32690 n=1 Tax=Drosophila melanogaster TaxID=7227 RepID=Q0Q3Y2_DROME|nr:CG32690 [Drosophila melanogaster]ABG73355.1 CG32690 [Drosophila melanogaster]ABG73357.1 CG32690 [Drosophila melanogaster]